MNFAIKQKKGNEVFWFKDYERKSLVFHKKKEKRFVFADKEQAKKVLRYISKVRLKTDYIANGYKLSLVLVKDAPTRKAVVEEKKKLKKSSKKKLKRAKKRKEGR